ncbi:MAG: type VI secretion system baseplate subunit TssG [Acetobacteraceae bacterium]|nr:type VI secretion system baseplate subunit TssG [Acetobacteraceae bacterium]
MTEDTLDELIADGAPPPPAPTPGRELFARLATAPWDYGFYQTMRRLEALHRDRPRLGRSARPAQDPVRLAQEPSVTFAPSTLAAWEPGEAERPPRLVQFFFGLFGPDGPLPLHLTEYARDRRRNWRDPTFQRFADVFHHRALSLFYRAWAESRPTVSFDRPEQDRFALYAGALIGLGMESLRDRDAMPDLTKLHFAGFLANQTRHADGLGAILSAFFAVPVRVESFVGAWLTLEMADRTRLGTARATGTLGKTALLGGRVWSRQHKFRIVFGPLNLADYHRLLPGGASFHRLIPIVRNYAGDTLAWDVNLVLKRDEVPPTSLGKQGRLGWTTWLTPRRKPGDAADLFLDASADSMARAMDARTVTHETAA